MLPLFDDPAKGRVAAGQPEAKTVLQNSRAPPSPTSVRRGQFFDIVKTGRKGNVDGEVLAVLGNQGNTTRSTVRFLEVHTIHERLRMFGVRCVSSSICRDADAKRANVERYSQISNLRV